MINTEFGNQNVAQTYQNVVSVVENGNIGCSEEQLTKSAPRKCRNYPKEYKKQVMAKRGNRHGAISRLSTATGIPRGTLAHWFNPPKRERARKMGVGNGIPGRPCDGIMESALIEFIRKHAKTENKLPSAGLIKTEAILLSSKQGFKASINWYDRFLSRHESDLSKISNDLKKNHDELGN